jgi:UDP-glucose 4-epimerase|uniref:SDR family NAD(P)-dependent oxidoreductase n=1 Tax=Desulfobacca acetoxidans TaxID=60893 RepID=A0A7C5AN14_9BACT
MNDLSFFRDARVLITGGAGMIGSTLAHLLVAQGAEVTVVDALLPLYGGNRFNLKDIWDKLVFVKGDIRDPEKVKDWVDGADYVFSLAAQVSYVDSNHQPLLDLDINCRGHLNLLMALSRVNRRAKVVFTSSRFVYGSIDYNPVDEGHPFNCLSIYGIHKLAGEKYYRFYHDAHGLDTVSLRLTNPYGPRQQMRHSKYGIVNWFIRLALEGKPLTVFGEGRQKRDYIYVEDVCQGILSAALSPKTAGQVYNLGSGVGTPFIDMVKLVAEAVPGTQIQHLPWPKDRYFVETGDFVADISKIQEDTGWRPTTALSTGIARTVAFYREHRQHYWQD